MLATRTICAGHLPSYIIKGVLKKPPRSSREPKNSHVNLKKRRICTVKFYEDLTVYIILKNPYHIILDKRFVFSIRLSTSIRLGLQLETQHIN